MLDASATLASLESGFNAGLASLLDQHRGLGVYILTLANAAYDPALWASLAPALRARHRELAVSVTDTLRRGDDFTEPDDDVMVFLKLHTLGFEHLAPPAARRDGAWDFRFNPLRALRPPRASGAAFQGLSKAFDAAGFHFNKPFLAKEIVWQGELAGLPVRLLYNKFPFARLHGLLVPEPERGLPQSLDAAHHHWLWRVCTETGVAGLWVAYNSLGAGASVNHRHFQSFVADALPLAHARWAHHGGDTAYPLPCEVYRDFDAAWQRLAALQAANQPFNLIYGRDSLYVIPRRAQDDAGLDADTRGWGWSEMAGGLTVFRRDAYTAMTAESFVQALQRFAP